MATAAAQALQQEDAEFAVWRADGRALLAVTNDREAGERRGDVRLWTMTRTAGGPGRGGWPTRTVRRDAEAVLAAAFSPSGDRVATAQRGRLGEGVGRGRRPAPPGRPVPAPGGRQRRRLLADRRPVRRDGKHGPDGPGWDVDHGDAESAQFNHKAAVRGVAFSPDGRWLLTWSADAEARVSGGPRQGRADDPVRPARVGRRVLGGVHPGRVGRRGCRSRRPEGPGGGEPARGLPAARSPDAGPPLSAETVRVTTWHLGLAGGPPTDRDRLAREAEYLAAAAFDERTNGFEPLRREQLEERAKAYTERHVGAAAADDWPLARFREAKAANRPAAVLYWSARLNADVAGRWPVPWDVARVPTGHSASRRRRHTRTTSPGRPARPVRSSGPTSPGSTGGRWRTPRPGSARWPTWPCPACRSR